MSNILQIISANFLRSSRREERGFALAEALIYIVIVAMLFVVVVSTLITVLDAYRSFASHRAVQHSAVSALERIVRETRNASQVSAGGSVFDVSPGTLVLSSVDDSGDPITIKFALDGDSLHLYEDGVDQGPLTGNDVEVTRLVFSFSQATSSELVRTEMGFQSGENEAQVTKVFYTSTVPRGSYDN